VARLDGKVAIVTGAGVAASAAVVALATAGCGSGGRHFAPAVDNPWFPLKPGTTFVYRGVKDGKAAEERLTVTRETKEIQGVRATVLHDLLYLDRKLAERTTDWYAQDAKGNVWYFGERTAELDRRGRVTSTEGSWEAGADGAKAGIYMPARPKVGQVFRQEYYKDHAEDHFRVISLRAPAGDVFGHKFGLLTREWTPLEPGVVDFKTYARGIGTVKERSADGEERLELRYISRS
jgi:hypothetical protein